ncbi:hypothetical protein J7E96_19630 [Streptomyces sp. ISL-96]|uniref:hypothetical protein n=1 Tax=Streptomyces sp. ISL-96 TaxID=2819191 RepID=UPI001BEA7485|nr:hypothetical protein [Streptomyces sp. ISL-96]MBT2490686.1 hypothetical protein [Streptomyces sp. ISL-96]
MSHQHAGLGSEQTEGHRKSAEPERIPSGKAEGLSTRPVPIGRKREFKPDVPVVLDGEVVEDLERMKAEATGPLSMTRLAYGSSLALGAFTDREAMLAEVGRMYPDAEHRSLVALEAVCTQPPDSLPTRVCFFEDADEQGDIKCLEAGFGYKNLSNVHRGFLLTQNWNDVISSLSQCRFDVSLFDAFDWTGNEFFAPKGCNTPNLARFGWGDRAASIVNWGS